MLMIWILGHWSLVVIVVGFYVVAAVAAYRMVLRAAFYIETAPVLVRLGRRGRS